MDKILDVFNDIPDLVIPDTTGKQNGQEYLESVAGMTLGSGDQVIQANPYEGLWAGGKTWETAKFAFDMNGHVKASDIDLSGSGYTKINIFKQTGIPTSISVGDLWFDTDDGNKLYRAGVIGADQIVAGEWELVVATSITVFAQNTVPVSTAVGDVWYNTGDNNKPYRSASIGADAITAGEWVLVNDLRAADALLKAGSTQILSGDFSIGVSNIKLDGPNKRILISDGTNDRILIGYQAGGF